MKKAFAVLFVSIFLFAVTRPARAGGNDNNDAGKVGIVAGALALIVGIATLGSSYRTAEREVTNRRAIDEEYRTQREQIRASTVLSAPSALGGKGFASYSSPEGTARIEADAQPVSVAPQYQPVPRPKPEYPQRQRYSQRRPSAHYTGWCDGLPPAAYERCMAPVWQ